MRVWRANETEWIAGPSLLSAARGACEQMGYGWHEVFDRGFFKEIPRGDWDAIGVWSEDRPDDYGGTLAQVVERLERPGIVMSTEW